MVLSYSNIIPYLINQLSWIHEIQDIDNFFTIEDYVITEFSGNEGRNRCFFITNSSDKHNYFIKQPKNFLGDSVRSVIKESLWYEIVSKNFPDLTQFLPTMFDYNRNDIIITFSYVKNINDFEKFTNSDIDDFILQHTAHKIGEKLKKFHQNFQKNISLFDRFNKLFEGNPPLPFFELDFSIIEYQKRFKSDLFPFIETIEQNPNLSLLIKEAIVFWEKSNYRTLIHGDFKAANVLITDENSYNLFIVDWEFASVGNYLFDIATFLHYLVLGDITTVASNGSITEKKQKLFSAFLSGYLDKPLSTSEEEIIHIFLATRLLDYWVRESLKKDDKLKLHLIFIKELIEKIYNKNVKFISSPTI